VKLIRLPINLRFALRLFLVEEINRFPIEEEIGTNLDFDREAIPFAPLTRACLLDSNIGFLIFTSCPFLLPARNLTLVILTPVCLRANTIRKSSDSGYVCVVILTTLSQYLLPERIFQKPTL